MFLLQIAYDVYYWNPFMHIFVWASIIAWFVVIPFTSLALLYPSLSSYVGVAYAVLKQPGFWFYIPLVSVMALFPVITYRTLLRDISPTLVDELIMSKKVKRSGSKGRLNRKSAERRSGYAFSHQKGFGDFIESGRGFGLPKDQVEAERKERLSKVLLDTNAPHAEEAIVQSAKREDGIPKKGDMVPPTTSIPNIPGTPIRRVSSQDSVVIC